jgi:Transposase and inactivated derivatives
MAHTFTNLLFHVIFGTKGREPSIDSDVRAPLHAYIGGIVRELNGIAIIVNGADDHVHALLKLPPTLLVADVLRVVKTNSSKWMHEKQRRQRFGWQSGYAAFTVSESGVRSVRAYIERQEEHHRKKTFAEEYIEFLEKNHVSYDPRYVFE